MPDSPTSRVRVAQPSLSYSRASTRVEYRPSFQHPVDAAIKSTLVVGLVGSPSPYVGICHSWPSLEERLAAFAAGGGSPQIPRRGRRAPGQVVVCIRTVATLLVAGRPRFSVRPFSSRLSLSPGTWDVRAADRIGAAAERVWSVWNIFETHLILLFCIKQKWSSLEERSMPLPPMFSHVQDTGISCSPPNTEL